MKYMFLFSIMLFFTIENASAQQLDYYVLDNGMKVILDQDPSQPMVYGNLVVNAGSKDEELDATGIAHYLEHMLFKGTEILGTANWEKEKEYMEKIEVLYDQLQTASDDQIAGIQKQINQLTIESSKYIITNEFSALIQEMGGVGLNAGTGKDLTFYHNSFPGNQLEKWMRLYHHRFEKPVFRLFQPELETVYEEKNRSADNAFTAYSEELFASMFEGHPYGRPIIGLTEHLKRPNMTAMKRFFETWYVPNNMCLILSGDFSIEEAKTLINETFATLDKQDLPERYNPEIPSLNGRKEVKVKLTPGLQGVLAYQAPSTYTKDHAIMQVASRVLSNAGAYGLLDQLVVDGEVGGASASMLSQKEASYFLIQMTPVFDRSQNRQLSFKFTEKLIADKLNQLTTGDFEDKTIDYVKKDLIRELTLQMESPTGRSMMFMDAFINGLTPSDIDEYYQAISQVTKEEVVRVAKTHLGKDYLAYLSYKGKPNKEELEKPDLDPIQSKRNEEPSTFASQLLNKTVLEASYDFVDFDQVSTTPFKENVELKYVQNQKNSIFDMLIIFDAGTLDYPLLKYAIPVINRAGIMGQYEANELRTEFAKLGVNYGLGVSDNETYIQLRGDERGLSRSLELLSKLMLIPALEDKAFNAIVGSDVFGRFTQGDNTFLKQEALQERMMYGEKSEFIDRPKAEDLWFMRPTELIAEFQKATTHHAEIHFYGRTDLQSLGFIMQSNLALSDGRKPKQKPKYKEYQDYKSNQVFLVDDSELRQTQVFLYAKGDQMTKEERAYADAFNQYLGGGFNGLMMKEIREYRALAYTAQAGFNKPLYANKPSYLFGYIGTQSDKTNDVVNVVNNIFSDMPMYEERFSGIKSYLLSSAQMAQPSARNLSLAVSSWKDQGYDQDPRIENLEIYKKLTFEDIQTFYQNKLKEKAIVIGILGKSKDIDSKLLKEYGNVEKMGVSSLFSKE